MSDLAVSLCFQVWTIEGQPFLADTNMEEDTSQTRATNEVNGQPLLLNGNVREPNHVPLAQTDSSSDSGVKVSYSGSTKHIGKSLETSKSGRQSVFEYFNLKTSGKISPMTANQSPVSHSRKSAWERARDAYTAEDKRFQNRRKEVRIEDIDVLRNETWFSKRSCRDVFKTKRFKNPQLEALYQRYFFKLNQYNLSIIMALFCVIAVLLIIFYYVSGGILPIRGVCLGLIVTIFIFLEVLCNRSSFDQNQAQMVCYGIIVILCAFISVITADTDPRSASDSVWCAVLFIYLTYTLLPVRMRVAVLSAACITVLHLVISIVRNHEDPYVWKQVGGVINWYF